MVNYIPEFQGYSGQGAFRYWCQKVLPLVYDDSLSYYELLNKVVVYLNNTIADVAKAEGNIDSLLTAYTQLQGYVNDYFDNLDVQEKINNKLDAMVESGELSDLLEPFIPDLVTDWLDNHVTPTSPVVDNSLSISGAAADAKVTGDEIARTFKTSNVYIEHSDLHSITSLDNLEANRIYMIGSDVTNEDIANMPNVGKLAYVLTFTHNVAITNSAFQIYASADTFYYRRKRLNTWSTWFKLTNENDFNNAVRDIGFTISDSDTHGYTSANDLEANRIYEILSAVTSNIFSDLPIYGVVGYVLTLTYNKTTEYSSQIYFNPYHTYTRIKTIYGWTEWCKLVNEKDVVVQKAFTNTDYNRLISNISDNAIFVISPANWDDAPEGVTENTTIINMHQSEDFDLQLAFGRTNRYIGFRIVYRNSRVVQLDWQSPTQKVFSDIGNMFGFYNTIVNSENGTVTEYVPTDFPNTLTKKAYEINTTTPSLGIASTSINIYRGVTYSLTAYAKGINCRLRFNVGNYYIKEFELTNKWEKYEFIFTSNNDYTVNVNVVNNEIGTMYLANVQFKVSDIYKSENIYVNELKGDWELGSLGTTNGSPITSTTRIRSRVFMKFNDIVGSTVKMIIPLGYSMNYRVYNENKEFVKNEDTVQFSETGDYEFIFNVNPEYYYKFVIFPHNSETIDLYEFLASTIKFTYYTNTYKKKMKILGIGNSHTRDAIRYVQYILNKNGYECETGHYYYGGISLYTQYTYLRQYYDGTNNFPTSGAFYRCYNDFGIYTSNSTWNLAYAIKDKPWDVVVFQQDTLDAVDYSSYYSTTFNFDNFILLVKQKINNPNLKVGLMLQHRVSTTYPNPTIPPVELFERIQNVGVQVAHRMEQCDFIANTGLAIEYARTNEYLNAIGNEMGENTPQGTHLLDGIPQYLASMTYASAICGDDVTKILGLPEYKITTILDPDIPDETFDLTDRYLAFIGKQYVHYATENFRQLQPIVENEMNVYGAYVTEELTGNPVMFSDGADDIPVKSLVANIDTVQQGTGTPAISNPRLFTPTTSMIITHNNISLSVPFGTEVGNVYGGTLNVTSGELTVTHAFVEFDGKESWGISWGDTNPAFYTILPSQSGVASGGVFSLFPYVNIWSGGGNNGAEIEVQPSNTRIYVRYDDMPQTVEEWKQQLATWKTAQTPLQAVYPLEEPITYMISENEIRTLLGVNNISTDTGDVNVVYRADTKLYIQEQLS